MIYFKNRAAGGHVGSATCEYHLNFLGPTAEQLIAYTQPLLLVSAQIHS